MTEQFKKYKFARGNFFLHFYNIGLPTSRKLSLIKIVKCK